MSENDQMIPIPAGALFTVSSGECSDYYVRGVFRAKAEINPEALLDEYLTANPQQREDYSFEEDQFLGWVAQKMLIEAVDCYEWHLSNYSKCDEMSVSRVDSDLR